MGLSPRGERHIEQLHLNRAPLVAHRRDAAQKRDAEEEFRLANEELRRIQEERNQLQDELERERRAP